MYQGIAAPVYKGEKLFNFDGTYFRSPRIIAGVQGVKSLLKWQRERVRPTWVVEKNLRHKPTLINSKLGELNVVFINHSTFLIQIDGLNIITDPVFANRVGPLGIGPKRHKPSGLAMNELPKIDIILLSHNHYDHLDIQAVKEIYKKNNSKIICPLGIGLFLDKHNIKHLPDLNWYEELNLNDNTSILCTEALHFSGRGLSDRNKTLWAGYLIKSRFGDVYFVGDTGYNENIFTEIGKQHKDISLALIPIGAYKPEWFMSSVHISPAQAVMLHKAVGAKQSIAMHWGTFALADDGMYTAVEEIKKFHTTKDIKEDEFIILENGESKKIR